MYENNLTKKQIDDAFTIAVDAMGEREKSNHDILQLIYHWFYAGVRFREQFDEATREENQHDPNELQNESNIILITKSRDINKL